MSTPASHTADLFWRATDAVRAEGGSVDVVVQTLAVIFLLRLVDFDDAEEEAIALFEGGEHEAVLPERLRWNRLVSLRGDELLHNVRRDLVPYLEDPPRQFAERLVDRRAIIDGLMRVESSRALTSLFSLVADTPFETPEDRRQAGHALGEFVARWAENSKYGSEFSTPPCVAELMAAIAAPKLGERIYDPCFGAADGLVACVERLRQQAKFHTPKDWERVQRESVFGVELNAPMHLIGAVRLMLAGIHSPALVAGDALAREVGRGPREGFDCIVAVPPWGRGPKDLSYRLEHLRFPKASLEGLFIQHIGASLRPGGRAVVAVPDGVLFRGGVTESLRRWLVEEYCVRLVVQLPRGTFRPYTNVATSLLVFERQPASSTIRVVDLRERKQLDHDVNEVLELAFGDLPSDLVTDVPVGELSSRHYEFQAPSPAEGLLDEALQALPDSVPVLPLRELVEERIRTGVHYRRGDTVEEPSEAEGFIPLVRVGDVGERLVRSPTLWARIDALRGNWEQRVIHAGDLVLTSSGTIGRVGLATNGSVGAVASNSVVLVRPKAEVASDYLAAVLRSPTYKEVLQNRTRGAVIPHLTARVLGSVLVPVPPLPVQQRISNTIRDHGGDAVAILRAVLADEGRPLPRFAESSPAINLVLEIDDDDVDGAREALSTCLAKAVPVVKEQLEALDGVQLTMWDGEQGEESPDRALLRWSKRLSAWLAHLEGVTLEAPATGISAVQYAQLSASDAAAAECLRTIPTDGSVNARRARAWLEKSRRLVQSLAAEIAARASIAMTAELAPRLVDGTEVVSIAVGNGELAPLSDVRITFTRSDGTATTFTHAVLRDGDMIALDVPIVEDDGEGPRRLRAEWSARRLDGSRLVGEDVLELRDMSSSTGELQELGDLGSSPYIVGNPVDQAGMFYGRSDVLKRIRVQVAREGVANVILLEGNRRTGKTSILKRLQDPEVLPGWLPVYCSFQQAAGDAERLGVPTEDLFRAIGMALVKECFKQGIVVPIEGMPEEASKVFRLKLPKVVNRYFREAGDAFQALNALVEESIEAVKPRRLLLMLDEFDKVQEGIDSGVTSPQAPENIRNLYQDHTAMAGILTGSRRIKRLREEYWHALFGFGYRIGVDSLAVADARALVTDPVRGRLQFAPNAVDAIINATARQPFLIQSVCARIFEQAADSDDQRVTLVAAQNAMDALVTDSEHFKTLWQYAGTDRRRYVLWLVHQLQDGEDPVGVDLLSLRLEDASIPLRQDDDVADDVEFLRELELVDQLEEEWKVVYRLTVPLMGRWMKAHVDPDIVKRRAREEEPQGQAS